ncbi:MAG TPA: antibiotic biosynthesis monooxygenase [Acidimicrobiaceae bacterium]|nr:antibiotic biosynthesis monooxygenase [Acidimicrobiaceae bacterium]
MSKLSVWARIPVQPGKRDAAVEVLKGAIANTRSEDGTELYILLADPKDPDALFMYELYTDNDALVAHSSADWFKALGPQLGPLLAGAPSLQFLEPLDGKGL